MNLYLRAEDEAQAKAALPWLLDVDGNWIMATHQWALDPVGRIVDQPAVFASPFESPISEATYVPGWHLNIKLLDEDLLPVLQSTGLLIDAPETPARNWA